MGLAAQFPENEVIVAPVSTSWRGSDIIRRPLPGEVRSWDVVDAVRCLTSARSYAQLLTPTTSPVHRRSDLLALFGERHAFVYAADEHRVQLGTDRSIPSLAELLAQLEQHRPAVDVVFADPWHTYADSLEVICAGIRMLKAGGHLLIHDCGPRHAELVLDCPDTVWAGWCGETWRAFVDVAANLGPGWDWYVIDTDFGIGVIRAPNDAVLAADRPKPEQMHQHAVPAEYSPFEAWSWLVPRRQEVLRLVPPSSLGIQTSDTNTADPGQLGLLTQREDEVTISRRAQDLISELVTELSADPLSEMSRPTAVGSCPMCGQWSTFIMTSASFRESLVCTNCFATSRYRAIALGVLRAIRDLTGVDAPSIKDLPRDATTRVRVLDTQPGFDGAPFARYMLPAMLQDCPWIEVHTSSYQPKLPWGASLGGTTTNQNLEALTFADDFFDLLITSDVMEHVRLYELAHAEIARVVRSGGVYLFTVPHGRQMYDHLIRVLVHDPLDPSLDEFVLPPEYCGSASPDEGPVLSFRVFGTQIDDELGALGFDVEYSCDPQWDRAVFETELFYCRRR